MKYYYKLINNETNETEAYVESSGYLIPENLCDVLGFSTYHAVNCTKQEYDEAEMILNKTAGRETVSAVVCYWVDDREEYENSILKKYGEVK